MTETRAEFLIDPACETGSFEKTDRSGNLIRDKSDKKRRFSSSTGRAALFRIAVGS